MPEDEHRTCGHCGGDYPSSTVTAEVPGIGHVCDTCAYQYYRTCTRCETEYTRLYPVPDGESMCRNCLDETHVRCHGCGTWMNSASGDYECYDGYEYCPDCTRYCNDCDTEVSTNHWNWDTETCMNCGNTGIMPYGHTSPSYWFGGPLPRTADGRKDGFYLGIENEITAHMDARPIHEWAAAHRLSDFFVCKEDSSVEGFEIVTQPFTPEFFETMMDNGLWESFFAMLKQHYPPPTYGEPDEHGMHVHIGKIAFAGDPFAMAAFCYLIGQDDHLQRIARREPTEYCIKDTKAASRGIVAVKRDSPTRQTHRIMSTSNVFLGRSSINTEARGTIEIRAFKAARTPEELASAVRLVYLAARYVRHLRGKASKKQLVGSKALSWIEFSRWVSLVHPEAYPSISGLEDLTSKTVREPVKKTVATDFGDISVIDFEEDLSENEQERTAYVSWTIRPPEPTLGDFTF